MFAVTAGVFLLVLGGAGAWHSLRAAVYDDRWSDRSPTRFARFGYRQAPLPMTRGRRIGGVTAGLAFMALGVVVLATS